MKGLVIGTMVLFSASSFACRVDLEAINSEVAETLLSSHDFSGSRITSQRLVYSKDIYPEVMTSSCPDATLFFHSFSVSQGKEKCEILTKYKLSYKRVEISPFRVLDIDCHN